MKIALTMLCGGLLLGMGCGGDDEPDPGLGTASLKQPADGGGNPGGNPPTPPAKKAPTEYKNLIKRPGAKPVMVGTNQITRIYHFEGTNRFSGIARNVTTNGLFTLWRIEHGLIDGPVIQKFGSTTNKVHEWNYLRGLKNGWETSWHQNGKLKLSGFWTNGVRNGLWVMWHNDGSTNRVDLYAMGVHKGKSKLHLSQGLTMDWTAARLQQVYVNKPLSTIQRMFGSPDKIVKGGWVYYNVKVNGAVPNKAAVTTTFVHQAGKVTLVQFAP